MYRTLGALEGAAVWEFADEETSYFSVDAFSQRRRPLLLGGRCSACARDVCAASTCSVFQTRRLCVRCTQLRPAPTDTPAAAAAAAGQG